MHVTIRAYAAEDRNKNAHLGLGLGKLTPLREDSESDEEASGQVVARTGAEVALPPSMPPQPDRDMCIDPKKLNYISLLGRGAFGEVHYGAWEAPDGQVHDVAIKVLLATRYGSLQECDKVRSVPFLPSLGRVLFFGKVRRLDGRVLLLLFRH